MLDLILLCITIFNDTNISDDDNSLLEGDANILVTLDSKWFGVLTLSLALLWNNTTGNS